MKFLEKMKKKARKLKMNNSKIEEATEEEFEKLKEEVKDDGSNTRA